MSIEIDWSKAPEGATHVRADDWVNPFRRRDNDGCWYTWSSECSRWIICINTLAEHEYIARPPGSPWHGQGLPPVGTTCECQRLGYDEWQSVTILAHHNGHVWATGDDGKHCFTVAPHGNFRPIKTPEQIKAEKIKCEIADLGQLIINNRKRSNEYELAAVIYQAGYRLQEPGK